MSGNSYFTVMNVTFISSGDLRNFKDKAGTFNNNKAVKFLKENGQVNYSIIEVEDADSAKAIILWEYKDKESREKCQDYWYCTISAHQKKAPIGTFHLSAYSTIVLPAVDQCRIPA